jgi:hypothetical protein
MITSEKKKQIVLKNVIKVDDKPVKYQEITINSENPEDMSFTDYFANDEAKSIYKENRTEIRKLEAAFEDEAYTEQEALAGYKSLEA